MTTISKSVPSVKLSNGLPQPLIGYGTFLATDPLQLRTGLRAAVDAGYRYIDTAFVYGNEAVIGDFLQEVYQEGKLKREDFFIVTKLPFHTHEPKLAEKTIRGQLEKLKTDYLDLYLMHNSCGVKLEGEGNLENIFSGIKVPDETPIIETWNVFEKFYKAGKFRAIGVSNFTPEQLQDLYDKAEIKPHNLQIEIHIYNPRHRLIELCKKLNISVTSYSTLGSPGKKVIPAFKDKYPKAEWLDHPLIKELAATYRKTPAQILLRHMVQRGISVIPKSVTPARISENFDVLDFEISADDIKRIDNIKERHRLSDFFFLNCNHPRYPPFEDFD